MKVQVRRIAEQLNSKYEPTVFLVCAGDLFPVCRQIGNWSNRASLYASRVPASRLWVVASTCSFRLTADETTSDYFRIPQRPETNHCSTCHFCAKQSATSCPMGHSPLPSGPRTEGLTGAQAVLLPLRLLSDMSHPHLQRRRIERPTRVPEDHP